MYNMYTFILKCKDHKHFKTVEKTLVHGAKYSQHSK